MRQTEILSLFQKINAKLTSDDILNNLSESYSIRTIRVELANLKNLGYLDYVGETRAREWFLVK